MDFAERLCSSVEVEAKLQRRDKAGISMLDHYTHIERVTGQTSPMLAARHPPIGGEHIVDLFWRLCAGRTSNGFGPNPLPFTEIEAFDRLNRLRLLPSEIQLLKEMDAAYLRAASESNE